MLPLATSTFLQVVFAMLIVLPVVILWGAAVYDVLHRGGSGLKMAAMIVLIIVIPILGPILYFVFRGQEPPASAEGQYLAEADLRREREHRATGTGLYR